MDDKKIIKIHNKSDKPDNIVFKENVLIERCIKVENKLPKFMKDYFIYLKGSSLYSTCLFRGYSFLLCLSNRNKRYNKCR